MPTVSRDHGADALRQGIRRQRAFRDTNSSPGTGLGLPPGLEDRSVHQWPGTQGSGLPGLAELVRAGGTFAGVRTALANRPACGFVVEGRRL